jgi:cardiolipin synthase A/B
MPLLKGIDSAKHSIEILIFRFDQKEIESALARAVARGVQVHALIAHTNRSGELNLRNLELRLLDAGVTVARTGNDLLRYHGKLMVVDHKELYLLAFNLTHQDVERSRSFGIIRHDRALVKEAEALIEADTLRNPYEPSIDCFVVSPVNARKRLAEFIGGAKKELAIYDPKISDFAMIRLLEERARAGVKIRIIGRMTVNLDGVACHKLANIRLHTRSMVRDGLHIFVGSQSLRSQELDARREVGAIFRDAKTAASMLRVFNEDWSRADQQAKEERAEADQPPDSERIASKVAKAVAREIPPVGPILDGAMKEVVGNATTVNLNEEEVEQIVRSVVKDAVKEAVKNVLEEVVETCGARYE